MEITVSMSVNGLSVYLGAESNGYSPDVTQDLVNRTTEMFKAGIGSVVEAGIYIEDFPFGDDDDEDEEVADGRGISEA